MRADIEQEIRPPPPDVAAPSRGPGKAGSKAQRGSATLPSPRMIAST